MQVFGRLFYFYNLGSGSQDLNRWIDEIWVSEPRQTGSGFQNLDRQTDAQIWVSGPRQTNRQTDNAINIYDS
jgi:hypothetical protein